MMRKLSLYCSAVGLGVAALLFAAEVIAAGSTAAAKAPSTTSAHVGKHKPTGPPKGTTPEPSSNAQRDPLRDFLLEVSKTTGQDQKSIEDLYRQYLHAIENAQAGSDQTTSVATAKAAVLAAASKAPEYLPLLGEYAWLQSRVAGTPYDKHLIEASTAVARKAFGHRLSLDEISVLTSALSRDSLKRMHEAVPTANRKRTEDLASLLSRTDLDWTSKDAEDQIGAALLPFKSQLLILAVHHQPASQTSGKILLSIDGQQASSVPLDPITRIAKELGVNIFILGCSTAESSPLGTATEISTKQAADGLARLFAQPISTFGELFERLKGDELKLVFDLRFDVHRTLDVTLAKRPKVGVPAIDGKWVIPKLQESRALPPTATTAPTYGASAVGISLPDIEAPAPPPIAIEQGWFETHSTWEMIIGAVLGFIIVQVGFLDPLNKILIHWGHQSDIALAIQPFVGAIAIDSQKMEPDDPTQPGAIGGVGCLLILCTPIAFWIGFGYGLLFLAWLIFFGYAQFCRVAEAK